MTRKEALNFLGLPEIASFKQIKKRIEEKHSYYEQLSKTSPSAFLRRLNAQHLLKVVYIQKDILLLQNQPHEILSLDPENELEGKDSKVSDSLQTMPVIVPPNVKAAEKKKIVNTPPAFLIRHTENKELKAFPLLIGKNFIGRKVHASLKPFIALEDDEFVSRVHAVVSIETGDNIACYLEDSALSNEGKASKNGTFLNGNNTRLSNRIKLKESDTIQIGETKLIFRLNTTDIDDILRQVDKSKFMDTVIIKPR
jgi:hypothetical protein